VAERGVSLDAALDAGLPRVVPRDRALFRELCSGAVRWYWRCRGITEQLLRRPLTKRDRIVEALMIVGVYQLDQLRLPAHAAIHTTVEACAALKRPASKGLVNGVLRNVQRRREALLGALSDAARDAHPAWLWQGIREQWPDHAAAIIEANNHRPPMTLRVNTRAVTVAGYLEALAAAGIEARALAHAPAGVTLDGAVEVGMLPGFEQGWVSVQDASAQWLPGLIAPQRPARMLDACAAPGGKLTHLLECFPEASVEALEWDAGRARRINENLERLGLAARVTVADAAAREDWWDGRPFDVVVLDVPCSGTGVIRRHPDIKLLRRASDAARFAARQQRLMEHLWPAVAPGGRMIYATCSILAAENQERVAAFLERAPDAREEPVDLPVGMPLSPGWQILPRRGGGDGFYYAVLRKTGPAAGGAPAGRRGAAPDRGARR